MPNFCKFNKKSWVFGNTGVKIGRKIKLTGLTGLIGSSNQYQVTPLERDERLSYFRSRSMEALTAMWKL